MADMEKSSPSSPSPTNPAGPSCACGAGPMRWLWLIIIVAAVVFLVTRGNNDAGGDGIVWRSDYQKAMDEAKSQNKPVLIVFHAKWCGPCRQMKSDTYSDPAVIAAAEPFVRIYIDTDEQPDPSQKYNVSGIPAFHVLAPNGDVVDSTVGYQTPDEFTAWLKQSLEKTKG